jgi:DNA-binding transcriptional LysR family regulator
MFDLNALKDFVAVIREGGFSAAGRRLGVPKSTVSKRVQDLEVALNVRLIERTTRALRLTPEGSAFYARAQRIVAEAEDAERFLQQQHDAPVGHLRISAPQLFGQIFLGPIAATFAKQYPEATLEIVLNDRRADLIEDGFDAAVRVGPLEDSSLIVRHIADAENILVAAPDMAARFGVKEPEDLVSVPTLVMTQTALGEAVWKFTRDGVARDVTVKPRLALNALVALHEAAVQGAGFAVLPWFLVAKHVKSGQLVQQLPDWKGPVVPVSIVYTSARFLSARLRAFIDALAAAFPDRRLLPAAQPVIISSSPEEAAHRRPV